LSSDTLSDVLRAVRLQGAVYFFVDAAAPWVAQAPPAKAVAAAVMPGSEHVIEYHVITRGACWAGLLDGDAVKLEAGDVIVFPHGDAHVVWSTPGMRAEPDWEAYRRPGDEHLPFYYREGSETGDEIQLVCGFLGCDARPFNPLLSTLPAMIHVHGATDDSGLGQFIRVAIHESSQKRAGGECVLARLSELMFLEVVRRYLEALPEEQTGWLAGLRDRHVGRALSLLHGDPAHPWTLEALSQRVGLSRSALADRFTHFVGQPPMQYLASWRMQMAAGLLAGSHMSVAGVALAVGYDSEAAFSRAFKKAVGEPPAAWRRRRTMQSGATA
jgi:AraC-like DNA-binding protein